MNLSSPFSYPRSVYRGGINLWRVLRMDHREIVSMDEIEQLMSDPEVFQQVNRFLGNQPTGDAKQMIEWLRQQLRVPTPQDQYFTGKTPQQLLEDLVYRRPAIEQVLPMDEMNPAFPIPNESMTAWIKRVTRRDLPILAHDDLTSEDMELVFSPDYRRGIPREILLRVLGPEEDPISLPWVMLMSELRAELSQSEDGWNDLAKLFDLAQISSRASRADENSNCFLNDQKVCSALSNAALLTFFALMLGKNHCHGVEKVLPLPHAFEPVDGDQVHSWRVHLMRYRKCDLNAEQFSAPGKTAAEITDKTSLWRAYLDREIQQSLTTVEETLSQPGNPALHLILGNRLQVTENPPPAMKSKSIYLDHLEQSLEFERVTAKSDGTDGRKIFEVVRLRFAGMHIDPQGCVGFGALDLRQETVTLASRSSDSNPQTWVGANRQLEKHLQKSEIGKIFVQRFNE